VLYGDGHDLQASAHFGGVLSGAEERRSPGPCRIGVDPEIIGFEDR